MATSQCKVPSRPTLGHDVINKNLPKAKDKPIMMYCGMQESHPIDALYETNHKTQWWNDDGRGHMNPYTVWGTSHANVVGDWLIGTTMRDILSLSFSTSLCLSLSLPLFLSLTLSFSLTLSLSFPPFSLFFTLSPSP